MTGTGTGEGDTLCDLCVMYLGEAELRLVVLAGGTTSSSSSSSLQLDGYWCQVDLGSHPVGHPLGFGDK